MGCTFTVEATVKATVETAIAATTDTTFRIETEPASFDASLSQIRAKTLVVEAGGLERRLVVSGYRLVTFRASKIRRHES